METKWLEDFVSLAETRSFSRSAQLRHVTQPAFSRRIQALEAWAGTDLVDRSSYPTRLTPAGQTLYEQALEILQALQSTRAMLRGQSAAGQDVLEFAVPHTLAFTFFPGWVSSLREGFGPVRSRLIALNVHDAMLRLVEGGCDLLIAYHHDAHPLPLDADRYEMVTLGQETVAPYCLPGPDGRPQLTLPGRAGAGTAPRRPAPSPATGSPRRRSPGRRRGRRRGRPRRGRSRGRRPRGAPAGASRARARRRRGAARAPARARRTETHAPTSSCGIRPRGSGFRSTSTTPTTRGRIRIPG